MATMTSDLASPPYVKDFGTQAPMAPSPRMKKRRGRRGRPSTNLDQTQVAESPMRRSVRLASRSRSRGRTCTSHPGDFGSPVTRLQQLPAHAVTVKMDPEYPEVKITDSCLEGEDSAEESPKIESPTKIDGQDIPSDKQQMNLFQYIWGMSKRLKDSLPRIRSKSSAVVAADGAESLPNDEEKSVESDASQEAIKKDNRVALFPGSMSCLSLSLLIVTLFLKNYFQNQNWPYELSGTFEMSSETGPTNKEVDCRCQCHTSGQSVEIFNFKGMMSSALGKIMGNN